MFYNKEHFLELCMKLTPGPSSTEFLWLTQSAHWGRIDRLFEGYCIDQWVLNSFIPLGNGVSTLFCSILLCQGLLELFAQSQTDQRHLSKMELFSYLSYTTRQLIHYKPVKDPCVVCVQPGSPIRSCCPCCRVWPVTLLRE